MSRHRTQVCVVVCFLAMLFGACVPVHAQNVGSVHGTVTDPAGASIVGAKAVLADPATDTSRTTTTNQAGEFEFLQVSPGTYRLEVTKDGFKKYVEARLSVLVATPTAIDVHLELGAITQQVIVESAAAPALNTEDATIGNTVTEEEVKDLPFLARNVVNLLTLQPGVVTTGTSNTDQLAMGSTATLDRRDGAVDGVRGNQTNITVDGVDANDWQNQAAFTSALPITLDSVQEFRVTTTNANATDGIVGGAQVALVTKSGSNDFHGNVRWYYRTSGGASNDFFNNLNGIPRGKDQRNIAGGSLGGPIKKGRAFFFLDNEERRESIALPAPTRQVPTDTLRDGVLVYACHVAAACPAAAVQGVSGQMYQIPAGEFGLPPTSAVGPSVQSLDPAGLGVNMAMINYMTNLPAGNAPGSGFDGGLAFTGLNFDTLIPTSGNLYTARVDYNLTQDGRQAIFVRGSLEGLRTGLLAGEFPGEPTAQTLLNNSRGIAINYNAQFSPVLQNTLRYGLTRIGVNLSGASGPAFQVRTFSNVTDFAARPDIRTVPVHLINDDASWVHGKHSLSFGGSFYFVRDHNINGLNSFPAFDVNNGFCQGLCEDAVPDGTNAPQPKSATAFTRAFMMLTGSITQVDATFFATPQGQALPVGTLENRNFAENLFEGYVTDSWKVRPNLTFSFGVHYGYETPPWETNGAQVRPSMDILAYFNQREINQNQGISSSASPLLSWVLAGRENGRGSWFEPNPHDFAPRIALAYSPNFDNDWIKKIFGSGNQSVFRLGAGLFYDRVGQALAVDADQNGSPGIANFKIDGSQQFSLATAPRFNGTCNASGCTGLPDPGLPFFTPPPANITYPVVPTTDASNLGFAVAQHLKTPYALHLTASFQRQLPKSVVMDVAYVGTLGRRLLGKTDFAQYLDLKDPASGTDLFSAYRQVAKLNQASPTSVGAAINPFDPTDPQLKAIPSIAYFNNVLPNMPTFTAQVLGDPGYGNLTPTQAFYAFTSVFSGAAFGGSASWSCALFPLDVFPGFGVQTPWNATLDPTNQGFVLFPLQFAQLNTWTNFANSNYHSVQVTVKRTVGYGTFAFNYVFSKSIDNDSTAENADEFSPNGTATGLIQNPFDLHLNRALSDFNLKHNFNGIAVIDLPFGRGKHYLSRLNRWEDAAVGGWEVTSAIRWHSGFPLSPSNGFNFPTNFFLTSAGTVMSPISTHVTRNIGQTDANGNPVLPNLFRDSAAALNDFTFTLPGLPGSRNVLTGPAFAALDLGINKSFRVTERSRLQLRVTAFNLFNSVNFSDRTLSLDPTSPATFGTFTGTANQGQAFGRQIEFAARYEF